MSKLRELEQKITQKADELEFFYSRLKALQEELLCMQKLPELIATTQAKITQLQLEIDELQRQWNLEVFGTEEVPELDGNSPSCSD